MAFSMINFVIKSAVTDTISFMPARVSALVGAAFWQITFSSFLKISFHILLLVFGKNLCHKTLRVAPVEQYF